MWISNRNTNVEISIDSGYYTYLQFIESVDSELNEGLTLTSMAMNDEYMIFNTQSLFHLKSLLFCDYNRDEIDYIT